MTIDSFGLKPCCFNYLKGLGDDKRFTDPNPGDVLHCECGSEIAVGSVMIKNANGVDRKVGMWSVRQKRGNI